MNKSILLSIRPEWVEKILNGKKTIEVRKQFPKDYKGWVYIYCTKGKPCLVSNWVKDHEDYYSQRVNFLCDEKQARDSDLWLNGKVVARFWCDKVEEIYERASMFDSWFNELHFTKSLRNEELIEKSCVDCIELINYLDFPRNTLESVGYAIHISKLEIFDKPRELSQFNRPFPIKECKNCLHDFDCAFSKTENKMHHCRALTKAPQNYCYVEGQE